MFVRRECCAGRRRVMKPRIHLPNLCSPFLLFAVLSCEKCKKLWARLQRVLSGIKIVLTRRCKLVVLKREVEARSELRCTSLTGSCAEAESAKLMCQVSRVSHKWKTIDESASMKICFALCVKKSMFVVKFRYGLHEICSLKTISESQ